MYAGKEVKLLSKEKQKDSFYHICIVIVHLNLQLRKWIASEKLKGEVQ